MLITAKAPPTFIIDCPCCKAKVAVTESGRAEEFYTGDDGEPCGRRVLIGNCPKCNTIMVGESLQIDFANITAYEDHWGDTIRVYPKPPKVFSSLHIPKVVVDSLNEADRSLQAGANIAACGMLGRALEALCRDVLEPKTKSEDAPVATPTKPKKKLMLGEGLKRLRDTKVIDDRLYDWSQQLRAFRNLAAHAEDISIPRDDAEDLQTFVNAIVENVYDLADRYAEFKERVEARAKRKKS
ncbi:MAG: DUF4145 domain-containing protein [Nitrospirota bacterium]